MRTIETGAGVGTVVFAMKGTDHTCIVPDEEQVIRIKEYCSKHSISPAKIDFIIDTSEHARPRLDEKNFDLVLMDGRHGFTAPLIDWFYMGDLPKIGGILIIDDIHIWTCGLLTQFLISEKEWVLLSETINAAIFAKHGNNVQHKGWQDQP